LDNSSSAAGPVLHPCPRDPDCAYCNGTAPADGFDWSFIDGAYCIALKDRPDRAANAAREFHLLGLCQKVTFYRPELHPTNATTGVWESHRGIAKHALQQNLRMTLIFEDDVRFSRRVKPRTVRSVGRALARLPQDWMLFFLGHWPVRAWFVRRNVLRTASGCTHAYICSPALLQWLRDHPHGTAPTHSLIGGGIDAAYALLPRAFAYFPMLATQRALGSDRTRAKPRRITKLRHIVSRSRYREQLLSSLMRPNEILIAALSPILYLIKQTSDLLIRIRQAARTRRAGHQPRGNRNETPPLRDSESTQLPGLGR
jgi:hypothetical protein